VGNPAGSSISSSHNGVEIQGVAGNGVFVGNAGESGLEVAYAGNYGVDITDAEYHGFVVEHAGMDGLNIQNADDDGISVFSASDNGIEITEAGNKGLFVHHSVQDGLHIEEVGDPSTTYGGFYQNNGVYIGGAEGDGIFVGFAEESGVKVYRTAKNCFEAQRAGDPSIIYGFSEYQNGLYVGGAEDNGILIGRADRNGIHIYSTGESAIKISQSESDGIKILNAENYGVYSLQTDNDGIHVKTAGDDGLEVESALYGVYAHDIDFTALYGSTSNSSDEWGVYTPDKIHGSNVTLKSNSTYAKNTGNTPLEPGDVVCIAGGVQKDILSQEGIPAVNVAKADQSNAKAVFGVVEYKVVIGEHTKKPGEDGKTIQIRNFEYADGYVSPGEYLSVVVFGQAEVNIDSKEPLKAGDALVAGNNGAARKVKTTEINGITIAENTGIIGKVLENSPGKGKTLVFVNCK
jgi:hypothetical protein